MPSITGLQGSIDLLDEEDRRLCNRLYTVSTRHGELVLPDAMRDWAFDNFGTGVEDQTIVRVRNNFTGDEALFNSLRGSRPKVATSAEVEEAIESSRDGAFCNPREHTPADSFGRVEGEYCVTASNVAKYDANHGLVIFDDHDPLSFTREEVMDYVDTAEQWLVKADGTHEFVLWHCLWKSAASIVHGHMQLLSSDIPYSNVQELKSVRDEYEGLHGADYFDDVYRVHEALQLGTTVHGARVYAELTPAKEKGVTIMHERFDDEFAQALYHVVSTLRDEWGVESFTAGVAITPWDDFPVLGRIVDRGSLSEKTVDVGGMELFAGANVIASDPYEVFASL